MHVSVVVAVAATVAVTSRRRRRHDVAQPPSTLLTLAVWVWLTHIHGDKMHDLIYIIGPNEAQWEAIKALQSKNTTAKNNKKAHHLWEIDAKPHPKIGMHFFRNAGFTRYLG